MSLGAGTSMYHQSKGDINELQETQEYSLVLVVMCNHFLRQAKYLEFHVKFTHFQMLMTTFKKKHFLV